MQFVTPNRKTRLAQLGYLYKHTFTIFGRDRILFQPIIRMCLYALTTLFLFALGLVLILYEKNGGGWLLFIAVLAYFYKFFYYNRVGLRLSHMTFLTASGQDPSKSRTSGLRRQVFMLGLVDIARFWIARQNDSEKGIISRLLLQGLSGLGDLLTHFLLPVYAIDRLSLSNSLAKLRVLSSNVPETLAGVFGINIAGRTISSILAPFHTGLILAGLVTGLLWGAYMPAAFEFGDLGSQFQIPNDWPLIGPDTIFSWFPLCCAIFLGMMVQTILGRVLSAIKVVYYTLFYARVEHADALLPELREELDGYLKLEPEPQ